MRVPYIPLNQFYPRNLIHMLHVIMPCMVLNKAVSFERQFEIYICFNLCFLYCGVQKKESILLVFYSNPFKEKLGYVPRGIEMVLDKFHSLVPFICFVFAQGSGSDGFCF